jgi:hypothetical protein
MILTLREMNECLIACKEENALPNLREDLEKAMEMMLAQKPIIQTVTFPDDSPTAKSVKEISSLYRQYRQTGRR